MIMFPGSGGSKPTKGPGAVIEYGRCIDALGQVFYGDPTGSLRVEIDLVRGVGRPGATPELTLNYAATTGDGVFGRHWALSVPSISRGTGRRLPRYRDAGPDADGFTSSRYGELVPALLARSSGWAVDSAVREGHEVVRFRSRVEADFPSSALIQLCAQAIFLSDIYLLE